VDVHPSGVPARVAIRCECSVHPTAHLEELRCVLTSGHPTSR